jgi:hypothetical protein
MNAASWIVLAAVLAAATGALAFLLHRRRTAGTSACCGCALRELCSKK